jgi:hypothetical protein
VAALVLGDESADERVRGGHAISFGNGIFITELGPTKEARGVGGFGLRGEGATYAHEDGIHEYLRNDRAEL